jgi:hypothetical protein
MLGFIGIIFIVCILTLLSVSQSGYIASDYWMTVNDDFERMWKEAGIV